MEFSKPCLGAKTHTWCRRRTASHRCCGSAVDFHGNPKECRLLVGSEGKPAKLVDYGVGIICNRESTGMVAPVL